MASIFDQRQPGVADQRPVNFNPSDLAGQGGGGGLPSANLHPEASSGGGPSPLGFGPVLTPEQQAAFAQTMGSVVYSLPAGGYGSTLDPATGKPPTEAELNNANSAYNKFGPMNANSDFIKRGIPDQAANARVGQLFAGLGNLPTAPNLTPSAQLLANQVPGGYKPELGPSINERLGHPWQGPWAF